MSAPASPSLHATAANEAAAYPANWSGVLAMSLCVFALIASEFMPVSLLSPIATTLGVSEGWVGYGIAISGAFAVVTSLLTARVAGRMDRKVLLLLLTALMCVSGVVVAAAANYAMYLLGRALIGVVIGAFWSMSAAVAIRLVPTDEVPKALALFNGGNALATVVAAPLGSYLGGVIGWRGAFFCIVPVAVIALAWQWGALPSMRPAPQATVRPGALRLLTRRVPALGMLAAGLFFMGQFTLFTYVRPFLEGTTGVDLRALSSFLLAIGVAGLVGTLLVGRLLRGSPYPVLILFPILMAVIALGLTVFGHSLPVTAVLLAAWGLVATAAPVGWWSWLAASLPHDAEAGGGLMVAVVQLCIALGSTAGGLLYDGAGYRATFGVSALLLLLASAAAIAVARVADGMGR